MVIVYAIRLPERNDIRALANVKAAIAQKGLRIDKGRAITCRRNGGLWQYEIPVEEHIAA